MKRIRVLSFCISLFSFAAFSSDMAAPGGEAIDLDGHFRSLSKYIEELIDSDDVYFDLFSSFSSCEGGDFVGQGPARPAQGAIDQWFLNNYFFYNGDLTRDAVVEALNTFHHAIVGRKDFEMLCRNYSQLIRVLSYKAWPTEGCYHNALALFIIRSHLCGVWSFRYGYETDMVNPGGDDMGDE